MSAWLEPSLFTAACSALPLVSIDLYVTRPSDHGQELLLGLRNNRPAQGWWFTPGGRIRKNEPLEQAMERVAAEELNLPLAWLTRAKLIGAWDHFYTDSAFDPNTSTHYVNLAFCLRLHRPESEALSPPSVGQHRAWRWMTLDQAAADATVHSNVQAVVMKLM